MKVHAVSIFRPFLIAILLAGIFLQPQPVYAASLPAEINKQFTPLQIDAGGTSVLRISIFNPNTFPLTNVAFTDNLVRVQTGLFVDTPNGVVNTCGGTATAVPGSTIITLSGGAVPAQVGSSPGQCYVEVNVSSTTAGNLINTIPAHNPPTDIGLTADGVDGGVPVTISNTTPASATITVIGVSPPSLSKGFAPGTIFVGGVSTLTITVNNNDVDTNLTGTSYTDTLPAGLQVANPANVTSTGCGAGSAVNAPVGGTTIALTGAIITPSVNCVVTVNVLGANYGQYLNRIPAGPAGVGSLRTDQGVTNGSNADANLNVQPVGVVKAFLPTTVDAGDTTTLTITLQNPNATPQPVTSVLDTLPADLVFTGAPTTNCGVGSTVAYDPTPPARWVFTGASIPAAVTPPTPNTCTITAVLQAAFSATGNRTNTIAPNSVITPTPGFTNYNTTSSTVTINPALTAAKAYTSPSYRTIPLGGTATVTITLTNNSSTDITDVDFTDNLPTGLTVSGTPASPQCGGGTVTSTATSVTLANGTIPANTSCTVVFNVTSTTPGVYDNTIPANDITACTATLGCVGNPTNVSTNPDLTVINAAQLPVTVAKSFLPVVVSAGQPSRVRITITAPQDIAISQINITDTLPAGVVVAPNTPPTPAPTESCPGGTLTAVPGSNTITFTNLVGNTLNAGASCNIDVYVVAANPGSYNNDILANTITTSQGRTNTFPSNTANLRVTGLTMSKAFYPTTVQANGISRLTITLENSFPEQLTNVTLTDNLPGTATNGIIVAPTPSATTTCGGTVTAVAGASTFSLNGGTVPAQSGGVSGLCTISVNVQGRDSTPASQSTQTNNIPVNLVSGTIPSLGVTVNPAAAAQAVLTISNLSIGVVKGFDPVLVYGGATSRMTVRLINPGTTPLTGVAFTDNMALLSPGIILANPPAFNTGACGGTLTGNPGDSSFSFSGGTILPNSFCELTLNVVMNVNGNRTNRIPVGAVTTLNGTSNTQATEASLTNLPGVSVNKVFNPNPVQINQVSRLTINITNTSSIPVVNMGVYDNLPGNLPDGIAVAAIPNVTNTCNGGVTANPGAQSITLVGGSIPGSSSCQISVDVISTRPGVYVNTIPAGALTADGGVTNNDPATDTLTVGVLFSLGNRVWFDTNNNNLISTGEVGVNGVVVQLYAADGSGLPVGPVLGTQTTSLGGYYRFDNLAEGDYVVVIPADNFRDVGAGDLAPTNPLAGYWSSGTSLSGGSLAETAAPDPDNDVDSEDNGTLQAGGAFAGAVISNAVTLGTSAVPAEPTNDADAPIPNPAGEAADNRSNRTVDFGFYRTTVGDLIFFDANTNGAFGAGEIGLGAAIVQLFASDGTTEINVGPDGIWGTNDDAPGGVTTGANGLYAFSGLPNGDYIVRVTPPAGYYSTVDTNSPADTADPDFNINNNDNGIGAVAGPTNWSSGILTMAAGEIGPNIAVTNSNGTTSDPTVDFGFVSNTYSVGNRVWFDTDNSSTINGSEVGVGGVRVNLYQDNGTTVGVFDAGDTFLAFDITDASGYYRFDARTAGNYVVTIPADNFRNVGVGDTVPGDPLAGYWSSGTTLNAAGAVTEAAALDPDNNVDNDDNGNTTFSGNSINYVSAIAVTLGPGTPEPTTDNDPTTNPEPGEAPNNRSNRTVDFGFYRGQLGNLLFVDVNSNGTYDAGDTTLAGATVQLFAGNGTTEINMGPDGILGTVDDATGGVTTGAGGTYQFNGLPAGDYIVRVTPPAGYTSTVDTADVNDTTDPDTNTDNNDNGIGTSFGQVSSGVVTLTPGQGTGGSAGAANNVVTNSTGSTSDPTLDFGFVSAYSLGNRVWYDTDNSATINGTEVGVNGVTVQLYAADAGGNPTGAVLGTATTANGGYYRFDNLAAADYVVVIPASQFSGGVLTGYWSSSTTLSGAGAVNEAAAPDPDNNTDSDDNGTRQAAGAFTGAVISQAVTLGPGANEPINDTDADPTNPAGEASDAQSNRTVDFGFYRGQLGNLVYVDANANGTYDAGDTLLTGATVQLFTSDGATEINVGPDGILGTADDATGGVTTGAGGTYQFSGLPAGDYIVRVTPPTGYVSTVDTFNVADTTNPNTNADNNDNGVGTTGGAVSSNVMTLTPGSAGALTNNTVTNATGTTYDPTLDFGFTQLLYSLGNRVWFDTNNDSTLNGVEVGVNTVRVELYQDNGATAGVYDAGDTFIGFDVTDANGYYRFDSLTAGEYVVLIPSSQFGVGGSLNGYWSSGTSLSNAGAVSDTTANDPDTTVVDSDDNGRSTFTGSLVDYVASAAVTLGPDTIEPILDNDPALNPELGEAPNNQSDRTVDFGFYRGQLGNLVFVDVNSNGTYDAGDATLAGATVQLFAGDGTTEINVGPDGILGTTDDAAGGVTTGAGGTYQFSGLLAGGYIVRVTSPAGYASTVDTFNAADTTNPNTNADNNDNGIGTAGGAVSSNMVTLTPGSTGALTNNTVTNATGTTYDPTLDFGFTTLLFSLGNRVWLDTDNSATINGTEVGMNGVTVQLYAADAGGNPTGAVLRTATTANGGYYRFDNLAAGDYVVVIPASQFSGGPLTGYWSSSTTLSGAGAVNETAAPDPDNNTDSDDNGTRQIAGTFTGAVISQAVTLGLNADEPINDTDADPTNPAGEAPDAQSNRTVDFGFYRMQLGNLVYVDTNGNGTYDTGEPTLAGATVQLFAGNGTTEINVGPDGIFGTADDAAGGVTTGAGGTYLFSGLPEGGYIVRVTPPTAYVSTVDTAVPADATNPNTNADNNDNGVGTTAGAVSSNVVTLVPGSTGALANNTVTNANGTTYDPTLDFGFVTTLYSLGNRVWFDNGVGGGVADDGLRNGTEPGINNVTVNLYLDANNDGTPDGGVIATTTTDANGYYRFDNLTAGTYIVEVVPPTGYASTVDAGDPDIDTDDNDDNGVVLVGANVRSNPVTLGPGGSEPDFETDPATNPEPSEAPNNQSERTVDFGFVTTVNRVSLGSTVFNDVNGNGLQDAGETGISGVPIQLYLSTQTPGVDVPVAATTTDVNGNYFFGGLVAGSYVVYIPTPPAAAPFSSSPAVTDTADNSQDGDDNGIQTASGLPVTSPVIVLAVDGETTSETYQGGTQDDLDDNNGDMTVDFGFVPTSTLVADPAVSKAGSPSQASVGETVVFTLTVTNTGNAPADNVIVTDQVPGAFDVISVTSVYQAGGFAGMVGYASAGPPPSVTNVTVGLGTLDVTDVVIITITTRVNASGNPPFNNTARLTTASPTNRAINDASSAIIRARTGGSALPATGFAPNVVTDLPSQPQNLKYAATDVILEIPSLGIKLPVMGIPKKNGTWDVTWLGKQAGWLEGTAFPSWNGNSVLTSHVYLPNGLPGPFVGLNKLKYGDKIIVHAYGERYTFEVRTNTVVEPDDASVMKHETKPWLTLITCKEYDEKTNTYKKRVAVRAVLVKVEADK